MYLRILLIIFLFGIASVCPAQSDSTQPDIKSLIVNLQGTGNYSLKHAPEIYAGETLYEYIDGAAQSYQDYGFVKVTAGEFENKNSGESIIVDIYDMGNNTNAFGIFSIFRLPKAEYLDIGTECQYSAPTLDLFKDKFYVQLAGGRPFPGLKEELVRIAKKIDLEIKGSAKPAQLNLLPVEGKIPHSERYLKQDVLGFNFLKEAWSAEYELNGKKIKLILICAESEEDAHQNFIKYKDEMKNVTDIQMDSADESIGGKDGNNGAFIVCRKGKFIIYASSGEDNTDLKTLVARQMARLRLN